MKNTLIIKLDTGQKESIQIGKPESPVDLTPEKLAKLVLTDIGTLCEALVVTIRVAHQMGIKDESKSLRDAIDHIQKAFVDPDMTVENRFELH